MPHPRLEIARDSRYPLETRNSCERAKDEPDAERCEDYVAPHLGNRPSIDRDAPSSAYSAPPWPGSASQVTKPC